MNNVRTQVGTTLAIIGFFGTIIGAGFGMGRVVGECDGWEEGFQAGRRTGKLEGLEKGLKITGGSSKANKDNESEEESN